MNFSPWTARGQKCKRLHMAHPKNLPAVSDLRTAARKRIPHFVWEYLDSATGDESTLHRNRSALDDILFCPRGLKGEVAPDLTTDFLGQSYPVPFGIAPVGMSGLIWPNAEKTLARHGADAGIPYAISTVATQTPEDVAPYLGDHGWFQMYPPRDEAIRTDMLNRVKAAGFSTLVVTIDVPAPSRRERQIRGGLTQPPKLTPRLLAQVALRPTWAIQTLKTGMPRMKMIDAYAEQVLGDMGNLPSNAHVGYVLRTAPDHSYIDWLRAHWDGPLIVKGVMHPDDAAPLAGLGVDAVWVSNHAGRQLAGAPAAITMLPRVRQATDLPIIFDSGIEGGMDMMRALALGADFIMLGRAWHYALGALGAAGPAHLQALLADDLTTNMVQIGAAKIPELRDTTFF